MGDRASTDAIRFNTDDNSPVRVTERAPVSWATELAALAAALLLLASGRAAMQPDRASAVAATMAFAVVLAGNAVAAVGRVEPSRLAPLLLALMVLGLVRSDSPLVSVLGFAAAALLPTTAPAAAGSPTWRWLSLALALAAVAAFVARVFYRDPFHELRCAPACVQNPWLRVHAPDLLRGSERALAVLTLIWASCAVVINVRRRAVRSAASASTFLAIAVAAVWAVRLLEQPRPVPGESVDRWLTIALFGAVVSAAALRAMTPLDVVVVRRRLGRFATALSNAGDEAAISRHLRDVTGDASIEVELGVPSTDSPGTSAVTTVMRNGRIVATISHVASARNRVAAAVTPATALALETQWLLAQARRQLVEVETSRSAAVHTTDEARRRLERDLHDGAQQRLLVVGMELAHAAERDGQDGRLRSAAARIGQALTDVRRIGRGDAAIIAELGLDDALLAIAGTAEVPMSVTSTRCEGSEHDCWAQVAATTAYRLVHTSLAAARRSGAKELSVELRCLGVGNGRAVVTRHDGDSSGERGADHDRVMACGGRIVADNGHVFEAWLP